MEQLDKIKTLFEPVLKEENVRLYDLIWTNERNNRILQVSIMREDGSMDIDTCSSVSEKLSEVLDESNLISNEYYLEVCSPGAEREIKDLAELPHLIGKHVYVRIKHSIKSMIEFTGDILEVNDSSMVMNYRDKALTKKVTIELSEIEFIRLAVKL